MASEVAPWLPPATVAGQLPGVELDEAGELPADVELARLAAAEFVEDARGDLRTPDGFVATARVQLGAALLAGRWHARKGSPQGLVGFSEFGPAAVMREDPDVARLLGLGRYGKPGAL